MAVVQEQRSEHQSGRFDVWISHPDPAGPTRVTVRGPLDEQSVPALADTLMDLVFALPVRDVVLDLRGASELCPATRQVIHNAELALSDQGALLQIVLSEAADGGSPFERLVRGRRRVGGGSKRTSGTPRPRNT